MKNLSITMIIAFALLTSVYGQEKTGERKWTIDPETGDTIYTESVTISEIGRYYATQQYDNHQPAQVFTLLQYFILS